MTMPYAVAVAANVCELFELLSILETRNRSSNTYFASYDT